MTAIFHVINLAGNDMKNNTKRKNERRKRK
jgi:hypothetical protein